MTPYVAALAVGILLGVAGQMLLKAGAAGDAAQEGHQSYRIRGSIQA